jgi:prevent-host-death family protein
MRKEEAMIDLSRDIHSLTDFKRKTTEFIRQLKETGAPVVLTVNGKAELVVQDAAAYQQLVELLEELGTVRTLRERLASARRGEGRPVDEFFDDDAVGGVGRCGPVAPRRGCDRSVAPERGGDEGGMNAEPVPSDRAVRERPARRG